MHRYVGSDAIEWRHDKYCGNEGQAHTWDGKRLISASMSRMLSPSSIYL